MTEDDGDNTSVEAAKPTRARPGPRLGARFNYKPNPPRRYGVACADVSAVLMRVSIAEEMAKILFSDGMRVCTLAHYTPQDPVKTAIVAEVRKRVGKADPMAQARDVITQRKLKNIVERAIEGL
jgi:hypothetical protein